MVGTVTNTQTSTTYNTTTTTSPSIKVATGNAVYFGATQAEANQKLAWFKNFISFDADASFDQVVAQCQSLGIAPTALKNIINSFQSTGTSNIEELFAKLFYSGGDIDPNQTQCGLTISQLFGLKNVHIEIPENIGNVNFFEFVAYFQSACRDLEQYNKDIKNSNAVASQSANQHKANTALAKAGNVLSTLFFSALGIIGSVMALSSISTGAAASVIAASGTIGALAVAATPYIAAAAIAVGISAIGLCVVAGIAKMIKNSTTDQEKKDNMDKVIDTCLKVAKIFSLVSTFFSAVAGILVSSTAAAASNAASLCEGVRTIIKGDNSNEPTSPTTTLTAGLNANNAAERQLIALLLQAGRDMLAAMFYTNISISTEIPANIRMQMEDLGISLPTATSAVDQNPPPVNPDQSQPDAA